MRIKPKFQRFFVLSLCLILLSVPSGAHIKALAKPDDVFNGNAVRALSLTVIDPADASNDVDTTVTITGADFVDSPTVYLGETELLNVSYETASSLTATVPWGMTPGTYTLKVVNSGGEEATMAEAFTVTDSLGTFITNGPYGGDVTQIYQQPGNPSMVYALLGGAGAFRSDNGGANWQAIHDHDWTIQLDFDASDPNILYLGADSNDLFRSDDNGGSWVRTTADIHTDDGCYRTYPAAHPTDGGKVYFGMGSCGDMSLQSDEGGVYYSINHGESWTPKIDNNFTDRDVHSLAVQPDAPNTLIAGTYNGHLFYTNDGGEIWKESTDTLSGAVRRIWFNPTVSSGLQAFAYSVEHTAHSTIAAAHIYESSDLETWTEISLLSASQGGAQMSFLDGEIWFASDGLYQYTQATDWQDVTTMVYPPVAVSVSPTEPQVMYIGSDFGVEKSVDGGVEWSDANEELAGIVPDAMAVSPHDLDTLYVKTLQGIFKSTTAGNNWQYLDHGLGGYAVGDNILAVDFDHPETVYFSAICEGKFCIDVSVDGGLTWEQKGDLSLPADYEGQKCNASAIMPSPTIHGRVVVGATIMSDSGAGESDGIFYVSEDYGETWSQGASPTGMKAITEIEVDAFDTDLMYAATVNSGLWRSEDGGDSWTRVPVIDGMSPLSVNAIAVHPDVPDKVYIMASDATLENPESPLYISEDRGESWIERPYIVASDGLIVAPALPDKLFYSLYSGCSGLCRSVDDGQSWTANTAIPRPGVLVAVAEGDRSIIYMGSPGGLVTSANARAEAVPGLGNVAGGGVYRLTQRLEVNEIFLPFVVGASAP